MIEVKTPELIGPALDWAVAQIEAEQNEEWCVITRGMTRTVFVIIEPDTGFNYAPSTDWNHGGPLIEKYNIQTSYNGNGFPRSPTGRYWCAYVCKPHGPEERPSGGGPTLLIAACRAIVAAKLGDTVRIPAELVQ